MTIIHDPSRALLLLEDPQDSSHALELVKAEDMALSVSLTDEAAVDSYNAEFTLRYQLSLAEVRVLQQFLEDHWGPL